MQANDFDDLFAQQLGRLPAPDFSERDWREVENRLVIKGLQRKLTCLTWALPLLGAASLAMAGGLYHQLRQAHREIEELKKTTAAVARRTAPRADAPQPGTAAFDTLAQTATANPLSAEKAGAADDPVGAGEPPVGPGSAPLPTAPVPETPRAAPSSHPDSPTPRVPNQPAPASEATPTFPPAEPARNRVSPGGFAPQPVNPTAANGRPVRERPVPTAPAAPSLDQRQTSDFAQPRRTDTPGRLANVPEGGETVARTNARERATGGDFRPVGTGRAATPAAPTADAGGRTTWGENTAGLRPLPPQPLALDLDPDAYRKSLVAAARRTVPRPVETKGEIRRAGQRAPFRLSGLLEATSVGLHLGLPTGWGNDLPAGRGSVLGGQVGVRLSPRWQVFADVSSQRISPERDVPRPLKGIPVPRFADPDVDVVRFRVNDISVVNVGVGTNFVLTDRFAVKPYLGIGYNLQVPRRYDVTYGFVKRPYRWPPQLPFDREERQVSWRDRFDPQSTHQFRLQGGVRYPLQPNLNVSLEGYLNTQLRRLPSLTDTGGLRVGLAYEF